MNNHPKWRAYSSDAGWVPANPDFEAAQEARRAAAEAAAKGVERLAYEAYYAEVRHQADLVRRQAALGQPRA
jgi:hypothetical protein